ncbi:MAG: chromosome segregation protein SMC [Planctomycetes bacterium RBG_16_64_12]|nr:MAG: chromosome segregation protein SMC [Planctomycetes bacterium RBG_16_64_12]
MLKALELVGFKSFADRTRFEFPSGITVVVGPNGSGKSNVVDAIKWVLGEQSVKSLRGKEMADVIFNGSGTRRAMNTAEITLTFDNSNRVLAIDTPEVHITRRVYRSGEGDYLINRQPCRLRDIRDLLSGTGMGTQAYSVIEQGKVDVLLQSSPRDRRVIFEEAAGISRFKAKKLEALRRLDRVQQNLLRLSDIVEEVENRLRSVRMQANKARRYKEYTDRLQGLRTQVGLVDWQRLSRRLAGFEAELESFSRERDAAVAEAEAIEARRVEVDVLISDTNESIRRSEARIAANRERIAAAESTIEHERTRSRDLEQEIARYRQQVAGMSARAGDLQRQVSETGDAVRTAEEHHRQIARLFAEGERELTELIERLDQVRGEHEQYRTVHMERMHSAAALGNEISGLESQVAATLAARQRNEQQTAELDQTLCSLAAELEGLRHQREELAGRVDERARQHSAAKARLAERRQECVECRLELAQLQQRQSGLAERASVLEELEQRHEGLSPGVKDVLTLAREATEGPFRQVRGLVADLFQVSVEAALLVEVALGETAQHVVVAAGQELLDYLQEKSHAFSGRVGFIRMDVPPTVSPPESHVNLEARPGVLGRGDRFVQTEPQYAPLARRLLGRTWFVKTLALALELAGSETAGVEYVTVAGERLAADGTLTVGPRSTSTGLISRRSELRALKTHLAELEAKIGQAQSRIDRLERQIAENERQVGALSAEHQTAVAALSEHGHRIAAAEERQTQLNRQRSVLEAELRAAEVEHESLNQSLAQVRQKQKQTQAELAELETRIARLAEHRDRLQADRQARDRNTTETKVELAKSEERLRNLRVRMRQLEESQQERHRAIAESRQQLGRCRQNAEQSQRNVLRAESEIAELYLRKEIFVRQTVDLVDRCEVSQQERSRLTAEAQRVRARGRKLEEAIHAKELAAGEIRHERNALAGRLREDYGIELAELEHEPTDEEQRERAEVQQEIDELRRKINNLGNVNLEALEELNEQESRHTTLAAQYKDLTKAKASLERIIEKINVDSRRLFSETLETIKGHFATLFRDLFGGGRVDIVLDEETDILESGIEIVARPPGKEPRSISLLSGGEKTLTCVALLLAIFRSRPSPFCVLDEVDAALDEANIDRFTQVLQDFLAWTQFILVTHSKKTMTCANTIYGVTMQESGVSKQVSVRFEDVSEDGEILLPPESEADRSQTAAGDEPQAA